MKKRFIIAFILLVILSTYSPYEKLNIKSIFKIKKIIVENNYILEEEDIKNELSFLYDTNIFFITSLNTKDEIPKNSFIESYEIKKIYPQTIKIKIFEKNPIALIQNKKEKKFFTEKGEIAKYFQTEKLQNLPIVFGDEKSFKIFYSEIKKINFPIDFIKKFYLFNSNRWDLTTKENQTIKLPIKNYISSLENFFKIKDQYNFRQYKSFDYRITNQLILK